MRHLPKLIFVLSFFILVGCKKNETTVVEKSEIAKNSIEYASGLSIVKQEGYSIVTVTEPWPNAKGKFTYVLKKKMPKFRIVYNHILQ